MPSPTDQKIAEVSLAQDETISGLEQVLGEKMPLVVRQARQTFLRDLPELLKKHHRKWVAYNGNRRLGIGSSKTQVYQDCVAQGLNPDQFLVLSIEPEVPREVDVSPDI